MVALLVQFKVSCYLLRYLSILGLLLINETISPRLVQILTIINLSDKNGGVLMNVAEMFGISGIECYDKNTS
jgi:hypothetical protein